MRRRSTSCAGRWTPASWARRAFRPRCGWEEAPRRKSGASSFALHRARTELAGGCPSACGAQRQLRDRRLVLFLDGALGRLRVVERRSIAVGGGEQRGVAARAADEVV